MGKPKKASLLDRLEHAARCADEDNPNWLSPHIREAAAEIVRLQALLAAPSPSATGNGGVDLPSAVLAWHAAEQARIDAVGAYNARLAYVRQHMPFGSSVDPEYQLMDAAEKAARALLRPAFDSITQALTAAPSLGIDAPEQQPAAWMNPDETSVMDAFLWRASAENPEYCVPVYVGAPAVRPSGLVSHVTTESTGAAKVSRLHLTDAGRACITSESEGIGEGAPEQQTRIAAQCASMHTTPTARDGARLDDALNGIFGSPEQVPDDVVRFDQLVEWLRARQDWQHVLLDGRAVRELVKRIGAIAVPPPAVWLKEAERLVDTYAKAAAHLHWEEDQGARDFLVKVARSDAVRARIALSDHLLTHPAAQQGDGNG